MKSKILLALALLAALLAIAPTPRSAEAQVPANTFVTQTGFQFTVAAAATPQQLSTATGAPTYCRQLMIAPLKGNTSGWVEVRTASATASMELLAGQILIIPVNGPLTNFWIKVFTNGDGVSCLCWTDR